MNLLFSCCSSCPRAQLFQQLSKILTQSYQKSQVKLFFCIVHPTHAPPTQCLYNYLTHEQYIWETCIKCHTMCHCLANIHPLSTLSLTLSRGQTNRPRETVRKKVLCLPAILAVKKTHIEIWLMSRAGFHSFAGSQTFWKHTCFWSTSCSSCFICPFVFRAKADVSV